MAAGTDARTMNDQKKKNPRNSNKRKQKNIVYPLKSVATNDFNLIQRIGSLLSGQIINLMILIKEMTVINKNPLQQTKEQHSVLSKPLNKGSNAEQCISI